jgi:hypothetical protein
MKPITAPIVGGMVTSTTHVLILVPVFFTLMKERVRRPGMLSLPPLLGGKQFKGIEGASFWQLWLFGNEPISQNLYFRKARGRSRPNGCVIVRRNETGKEGIQNGGTPCTSWLDSSSGGA